MSSNKEEKVNQLALRFGRTLEMSGVSMQKSALKAEPDIIDRYIMAKLLDDYGIKERQSLYDQNYYLLSLAEWKRFIKHDWVDLREYLVDKFDCDNFAYLFAARAALLLGVNSAGVAGGLMKKATGSIGHAYTIIVTKEKKVYAMETQTDVMTEIQKGRPTIISGIEYTINWVTLF